MFLQLLVEWREDQSKPWLMFTQEMLIAKPESDLRHLPDSVVGCSRCGVDLQLPRLLPQVHHRGSPAATKQQDLR